MSPRRPHPLLAPASRVGNARRRGYGVVVPAGRRVYRPHERPRISSLHAATLGAALAAGTACGVHYFRSGGFALTALWLSGGALVLAAVAPAWAISLAVVEGLGVSLTYAAMVMIGLPVAFPPEPPVAILLALLPSLAGALLGIGCRRVFGRKSSSSLRR